MLSKSTEYAIRALVFVQLRNWEHKRPGVIELAREIEAPEAYTAKILQLLTKHKFLDSMKGRGGGFFFNEDRQELSLYEVIHILEGDTCFHKCGLGLKECCDKNPCPLHNKYKKIRDSFFNIVRSETIQHLTKEILNGNAVLSHSAKS